MGSDSTFLIDPMGIFSVRSGEGVCVCVCECVGGGVGVGVCMCVCVSVWGGHEECYHH